MLLNCTLLSEGAAKGIINHLVGIGCSVTPVFPEPFYKGKYAVNLCLTVNHNSKNCIELANGIGAFIQAEQYKCLFLQVIDHSGIVDAWAFNVGNLPQDQVVAESKLPDNVIPFKRPLKIKKKENVF